MKKKLTAKTVNALEPKEKPYEVRDSETKGFLLRVQPSGAMAYYLDYRTAEGRRNRYKIGLGGKGGLTPEQARDVAEKKAGDVAHGVDLQTQKKERKKKAELAKFQTLRAFIDHKYEPWAKVHHRSWAKTLHAMRYHFGFLMDRPMPEITKWQIDKWVADQKKAGKAIATTNRCVAVLKSAINKAIEWEVIDSHPLKKVKPIKTDDQAKIRYLAPEEEARLREALDRRETQLRAKRVSANEWRAERGYPLLPDLWRARYADHLKPMVLLSINTGMRRGEVFKLDWSNVNFATKTVTVEARTAKSNKTRHIPLNAEALAVLRQWKNQAGGDGLVFKSKGDKGFDNVDSAWEKLLASAKVKAFRWHDLRHHFASRLVMAGVDLNTVRELLGHADIKMTLRYAHLAPAHKAEAVARLVSK